MVKDLTFSILLMLLAVWLAYNELHHWDDESIQKLRGPYRKYFQFGGITLLFTIGLLYFLDTLGLLH